ncbi:MAG: hypothetical protein ABI863_10205 [Ginsengibacter sp.]
MKTNSKVFVLYIILFASYNAGAQVITSSRPYLFNNFSANIPATVTELDKAFLAAEGSSIQLNFMDNFSFAGTVSSSIQRYSNLSSVIIKLPSLHNSLLSISRRINDDNTITYVGRIINEKYADGYELKKDNYGKYTFNKIKTEDLIQDFN